VRPYLKKKKQTNGKITKQGYTQRLMDLCQKDAKVILEAHTMTKLWKT
jgi:hypothetical protein